MCPRITKTPPKLLQNCQKSRIFFGNACHFRIFFLIRAGLRFFCEFSKILGKGKAGLHGAIAAAAQSVGTSAVAAARNNAAFGKPCASGRSPASAATSSSSPSPVHMQDEASGAHHADCACVGGEEGEEEEADAQRDRHEPPRDTANGGPDPLANRVHGQRGQTDRQ